MGEKRLCLVSLRFQILLDNFLEILISRWKLKLQDLAQSQSLHGTRASRQQCPRPDGFQVCPLRDKAPIEWWRRDRGKRRVSPRRVCITLIIIPTARASEVEKEESGVGPGQGAVENDGSEGSTHLRCVSPLKRGGEVKQR